MRRFWRRAGDSFGFHFLSFFFVFGCVLSVGRFCQWKIGEGRERMEGFGVEIVESGRVLSAEMEVGTCICRFGLAWIRESGRARSWDLGRTVVWVKDIFVLFPSWVP